MLINSLDQPTILTKINAIEVARLNNENDPEWQYVAKERGYGWVVEVWEAGVCLGTL